jgi:DNA-binding transcriptional MerR regulator/methylmalonyl-CoA mutase cobalamin-binding subunit
VDRRAVRHEPVPLEQHTRSSTTVKNQEQERQGYPIRVVARRTGLTSHAIRIWEKRYNAVSPERTPTNRRLYSDAEIERLTLLRKATLAGHSIGQIARLATERLRTLVAEEEALAPRTVEPDSGVNGSSPAIHLDTATQAVRDFDPQALQTALTRASVALSQPVLIEQVVVPLMYRIGDLWRDGRFRVAHEHLASAVVRNFLGNIESAFDPSPSAPSLVVTTPAGQLHEFGALIVSATAASDGWRSAYLGPNLPAEEIAAVAEQHQARAIALSVVYPGDDPRVPAELRRLRGCLPEGTSLLVGGRAATGYRDTVDTLGAVFVRDIPDLRSKLESLRSA